MKKSLLAISVFSLFASTAQAQWQTNFLFGISGGLSWHNNDDLTVSVFDSNLFESISFNNDSNGTDSLWGIFGGYQAICNGWLLGAELNLDWRTNEVDQHFVGSTIIAGPVVSTISRDRDTVVGLSARIGREMTPWFMPYIRLGADFGRNSNEFTFSTINLQNNISIAVNEDTNRRWGFFGGIGAEVPLDIITCGLSLRAEWDYHSRGHRGSEDFVALASNGTTLIGVSGLNQGNEQTARASLVFNIPG